MELYFWNIHNNKAAADVIGSLDFSSRNILFSIAEFWDLTDYIHRKTSNWNFLFNDAYSRTGILSSKHIDLLLEKGVRYYTRYRLRFSGLQIALYVLHLKPMSPSELDSERLNAHVLHEIAEEIFELNSTNVIIVGDFNLPHFHDFFFDIFYLNSTDYWSDDEAVVKTYQGYRRVKFYNPIVSFSGDISNGPPGTYYYQKPSQSQAWYIFDNIFITYYLTPHLDKRGCEIVTHINGTRLVGAKGRPNSSFSDHLPIKIILT